MVAKKKNNKTSTDRNDAVIYTCAKIMKFAFPFQLGNNNFPYSFVLSSPRIFYFLLKHLFKFALLEINFK